MVSRCLVTFAPYLARCACPSSRYISKVSGAATLFDVRRSEDYDASKAVDRLLNRSDVKTVMQADPKVRSLLMET